MAANRTHEDLKRVLTLTRQAIETGMIPGGISRADQDLIRERLLERGGIDCDVCGGWTPEDDICVDGNDNTVCRFCWEVDQGGPDMVDDPE